MTADLRHLDAAVWKRPVEPASPDRWLLEMDDGCTTSTSLQPVVGMGMGCTSGKHESPFPYAVVVAIEPVVDRRYANWILECGHVADVESQDAEAGNPQFCVDCADLIAGRTWSIPERPSRPFPSRDGPPTWVAPYTRVFISGPPEGPLHRMRAFTGVLAACGAKREEGAGWRGTRAVVLCPLEHGELCRACFPARR